VWEPALLAMAVGQLMKMSAVLAESLAGLAPTGVYGMTEIDGILQKLWEPALLVMAVGQLMKMLAVLAKSLAGLAPTGIFGVSWIAGPQQGFVG
jgi:uncharacterized protein (DUF2062 family)